MGTIAIISLLVGAAGLVGARLSKTLVGAAGGMMVATVGAVCFVISGLAWVFG